MASAQWLYDAFDDARRDFLYSLPSRYYSEFSKFGTIADVYREIEDIQSEQNKSRSLVALRRMKPYLDGLDDYFGAVDTFVQIKPEILCLIWGPLRLILQFARSLAKVFEKLVTVLDEIGHMLPQFKRYAISGIINKNDHVKSMMCLFYRDILDLHLEMFKFFQGKRAHMLLETLWPHFRSKLFIIQSNIENHKMVMTSNVTLEHVLQSHEHRRRELERYEVEKESQNNLNLKILSDMISSPACDSALRKAIQISSNRTGDSTGSWFFDSTTFKLWLQGGDAKQRRMWLRGIPGAGKTILTANIIKRLGDEDKVVLFAFLTNDNQAFGSVIPVLHSLIQQTLKADHSLIDQVFVASKGRNFTLDSNFIIELFCKIASAFDPLILAIDGLDEIEEQQRNDLLKTLLAIVDRCSNIRLLVSSREERDILRLLQDKAQVAKLDENNGDEIEAYVKRRGKEWVANLQERGADDIACASIMDGLRNVVSRARGMFLYAQLVLDLVKIDRQTDLDSILAGLKDLPEGLDQAYGRILLRLRNSPIGKRILLWIAHARTPIKEAEILQAILIKAHMVEFPTQRQAWVDIRAICGPVIELRDGLVRFVHFTAKEFLIGDFSQNFLGPYQGHVEAVITCLTYLSLKSLDVAFSPEYGENDAEQLKRHMMSGDFVLFPYAADSWFEHIQSLSRLPPGNAEEWNTITQKVAQFYNHRKGSTQVQRNLSSRALPDHLRCFKSLPDIQESLAESSRFYSRLRYGHLKNQEEMILEDPTAVSRATDRFKDTLETMISSCSAPTHTADCQCQKLHKLYGNNVFKCKWKSCPSSQSGFRSAVLRDTHHQNVHRTFKCPKSECPFTMLGFPSKRDLEIHMAKSHEGENQSTLNPNAETFAEWNEFSTNDIFAMLEEAVMNNDVSLTEGLLDTVTKRGATVDFTLLLQLAVWKGSDSMMQWLLSKAREHTSDENGIPEILQHSLHLGILLGNTDRVRILVKNGANPHGDGGFIHPKVRKRYLSPRGIHFSTATTTKTKPIVAAHKIFDPEMVNLLVHNFGCEVLLSGLSIAISERHQDPLRVIDRLPQFEKYGLIHPDAYNDGIYTSIKYLDLGALELCLTHGADPNFPSTRDGCEQSPLFRAVDQFAMYNKDKGLSIIERLLEAHASPYPRCKSNYYWPRNRIVSIEELQYMSNVEQHSGLKWKEMVERLQAGERL